MKNDLLAIFTSCLLTVSVPALAHSEHNTPMPKGTITSTAMPHKTTPHKTMPDNTMPATKMMTLSSISPYSFSETRQRILDEVKKRHLMLFAELDHAAAARSNGLHMPDTTVLVFGSPKLGTPIMLEHPSLALDLPYRVLIATQADGKVKVSSPAPDSFRVHHLSQQQLDMLAKMPGVIQAALQP